MIRSPRAQTREGSSRHVRSGDGRAVKQRRRLAAHAQGDLRGAGGHRLDRLRDAWQVGGQSRHARHRAAGARCALAVVMMFCRRILCGSLVMRVHSRVVMHRAANVRVALGSLMMHRHGIGQQRVIGKARRRSAPGESGGRREDAKQIGEGDKPPHPNPRRPRQLQQHPPRELLRGNCAHAVCKLMANRGSAKLFLPLRTAHAQYRGMMLDRRAVSKEVRARARAQSSPATNRLHP